MDKTNVQVFKDTLIDMGYTHTNKGEYVKKYTKTFDEVETTLAMIYKFGPTKMKQFFVDHMGMAHLQATCKTTELLVRGEDVDLSNWKEYKGKRTPKYYDLSKV